MSNSSPVVIDTRLWIVSDKTDKCDLLEDEEGHYRSNFTDQDKSFVGERACFQLSDLPATY